MEYRDIKGVMRYNSGLFLYDPPTGRGKSYAARMLLYKNCKKGFGKQIFITNNIKNLSVDEMRELFQKDGREDAFDQDVLQIKANVDFVIDNLPNIVDYPEKYKTEQYKKIYSKIREYKNEDGQKKKELEEHLMNELEPKFRNELKRLIRKDLPKKLEERQQVINEDEKWSWLSRLYPTAKIWNYKIYIMTVKKFIQVTDPIIDSNFIFLNSDFTEDATIVIDEFDETKQVLLEDIIDFALKSKIDLLGSFRQIHNALTNPRYINILKKYDSKLDNSFLENRGKKFPSLVEEVEQLYSNFRLDLFYKTVDSISDSFKVVFFDSDHHFSYDAKNNLTSGIVNEADERVDLSFVSREEYKASKEKGIQMEPLKMISALYEFIEKFKFVVEQWAYQLRTEANEQRGLNDDRMTRQQSIESMFRLFGLDNEAIRKLVNRKVDRTFGKRKRFFDETAITMQWYEYVDSDSNYFETMIQLLRIEDMPETSIITLAKRSRVIGLSATALTPTVLGNYDLRKIQNHLGDKYHVAFEEETLISEETKREYKNLNKMYQEKGIGFDTYSFENFHDLPFTSKKMKKILESYASENDENLLDEISQSIKTDIDNLMDKIEKEHMSYCRDRYVELIESFCIFITSRRHHSILALQNALPKEKKWEFEENFIRKIFNVLTNYYDVDADLCILRSVGFEEDKKNLLSRLSNGEKLYILTSYATTGAGQNLQYEICEASDTINVAPSVSEKSFNTLMKDIDGVYLGNITYLLSYLNFDVDENALNKQILYLLVEIEYLFSNGEITREYKNKIIDSLLKIYASRQPRTLESSGLDNTLSVRLKATKLVIQAVGRITRTQNKTKSITLLISQQLLERISDEGLNLKTITPEMNAILAYKKERKFKPMENIEVQRNRRNNLILNNANKYIDNLLTSIKNSEKAREDWGDLRIKLMREPTVDHLPEGDLVDAYIEVPGGKGNSYFYAIYKTGETQKYYFGKTKDAVRALVSNEIKPVEIYEVSEEKARLSKILAYSGMKEYFLQQKFATEFEEKRYIVNPIFYQQILKGAYGEFAGRYIIETELGTQLKDLKTDTAFELFDYRDDQGNYYDFKNWHETSEASLDVTRKKTREKLYQVGGKRAWLINLIKPRGEVSFKMTPDKKIVEIPWLIDSRGNSQLRKWTSEIWREFND